MREPIAPAVTRTHLDLATAHDEAIHLHGWTFALDGSPIDTIRVSVAGVALVGRDGQYNLDSPDVQRAFPTMPGAGRARFRIQIPLHDRRIELQDALIALTPVVGGRDGAMILRLVEPSLPVPDPKLIQAVGGGNVESLSCEFLGYFIQLAGLELGDRVLDVGSGVGRMAYALAYYLAPTSRYEGFDIMPELVEWTRNAITPHRPNFTFRLVDIQNPTYNPNGKLRSSDFAFPYPDASFDFVFLASVFTHMQPGEVRRYLDEIRRVLRPGGRCLCTCFLGNDESRRLIADGKDKFKMVHDRGEFFTSNPQRPENAIGFPESSMLGWIADRGFALLGTYYGAWCGRAQYTSFQDMLVLEKRG